MARSRSVTWSNDRGFSGTASTGGAAAVARLVCHRGAARAGCQYDHGDGDRQRRQPQHRYDRGDGDRPVVLPRGRRDRHVLRSRSAARESEFDAGEHHGDVPEAARPGDGGAALHAAGDVADDDRRRDDRWSRKRGGVDHRHGAGGRRRSSSSARCGGTRPGYGAHTDKASPSTSTKWYFAEGSQGFFFTYLLLANPHDAANRRR